MTSRHPTARRVHRQEAAPDDVFVAGVLESSAWAKQHSRALIIGGILAAVLITALVLTISNRAERRDAAEVQLTQLRAVAMSGNSALAVRELEQFLARYDGTPAAEEARLLLGRAYLDTGSYQQAIEAVQSIAGESDTNLGANAAFLQAAAHEAIGEVDQAETVLLAIAEDARFLYQRQEALENAARLRLQSGDAAGSVELYDRLVEMTPQNSAERGIFEMRAAEARTLEATGGAQPQPVLGAQPQQPAAVPAATQPAAPDTAGG